MIGENKDFIMVNTPLTKQFLNIEKILINRGYTWASGGTDRIFDTKKAKAIGIRIGSLPYMGWDHREQYESNEDAVGLCKLLNFQGKN